MLRPHSKVINYPVMVWNPDRHTCGVVLRVWIFILAWLMLAGCLAYPSATPAPGEAVSASPRAQQPGTPGARTRTPPSPAQTATPTLQPTSQYQVGEDELAGRTVKFWHSFSGRAAATVQDLVAQFNRENEYGLKAQAVYQGTYDDLNLRLLESPGDLPDITAAYPYQALGWESVGQLVDLGSLVSDPLWGFTAEEQADFYPRLWEQGVVDERRFGLPALTSAQMLYYNQSLARRLGFNQPPASPDEFRRQACAAAQATDEQGGAPAGYLFTIDYASSLAWLGAFGWDGPSGEADYAFDGPATEDAFRFLRSLYDDGCLTVVTERSPEPDFARQGALFIDGSAAGIAHQQAAFQRAANSGPWTVTAYPGDEPVISAYGPVYVIFASDTEQELAAWLFLKWLSQPENMAALSRASGLYPVRAAAAVLAGEEGQGSLPQWRAGLELLPGAAPEPGLKSWGLVRWALEDATTQVFRNYGRDEVPVAIELLIDTAEELAGGP